jgi:hypothetical protein
LSFQPSLSCIQHTSGIVGQTDRETEAWQLMRVGDASDDITNNLRVDDLASDIAVGLYTINIIVDVVVVVVVVVICRSNIIRRTITKQ